MTSVKTGKKRVKRDDKGRIVAGSSSLPGGGRPHIPDDVKEALTAGTLPLLEKAHDLIKKAEKAKDYSTAARLVLGLLKKTVPDTQTLLVSTPDGGTLRLDADALRRMSIEDLSALRGIVARLAPGS